MKTITVKDMEIGEGIPKICVPITGETKDTIEEELKEISDIQPDLIEWRVDCYKSENKEDIWEMLEFINSRLKSIPLIFTFRTKKEGGEQEIEFADYEELLVQAAKTQKTDIIDVEVFFCEEASANLISEIQKSGVKVIASNHHFHETPGTEELVERMKKMDACGADILKMAVMPKDKMDLCPILEATIRVRKECKKPVVTMSMGKTGVLSRLWGEFTGSCITFASGRKASAPGQVSVVHIKHILEIFHNIMEA